MIIVQDRLPCQTSGSGAGGAERIRGELLTLGVRVSKRTIQKYRPKVGTRSSQTWAAFLSNHAGHIWTCDFTVAHDLRFRALYIFVVMERQTRRIVHTAVTRSPTDDWTAQQLREATPWGKGPRYLACDWDNKYGPLFLGCQGHGYQGAEGTCSSIEGECDLRMLHLPHHQVQSSPRRCWGATPCLFPRYVPALTYELRPIETSHQRLVNSLSRLPAALELIDGSGVQLFVDGLSLSVPVLAARFCSR
jgi:hypothetical protein